MKNHYIYIQSSIDFFDSVLKDCKSEFYSKDQKIFFIKNAKKHYRLFLKYRKNNPEISECNKTTSIFLEALEECSKKIEKLNEIYNSMLVSFL